jgi:hypothetical protein
MHVHATISNPQDLPGGSSSSSGGGPATIADGADVAQGAVADAVVAAGAGGTVSAKLRRLTTDLAAALTKLDTLHTDLTSLAGFEDGVEGLLTTLGGYVDGLEALATSLNGYVDGLEGMFKVEDGTPANGDAGLPPLGIRMDTPASGTSNTKYQPQLMSRRGQWMTALPAPLPNNGGHQQDTTIDSVTDLAAIAPAGSTHVVVQCSSPGKNIRYTTDGSTNPTTTKGYVMVALDPPLRFDLAVQPVKIIAETSGAVADYHFEGS